MLNALNDAPIGKAENMVLRWAPGANCEGQRREQKTDGDREGRQCERSYRREGEEMGNQTAAVTLSVAVFSPPRWQKEKWGEAGRV